MPNIKNSQLFIEKTPATGESQSLFLRFPCLLCAVIFSLSNYRRHRNFEMLLVVINTRVYKAFSLKKSLYNFRQIIHKLFFQHGLLILTITYYAIKKGLFKKIATCIPFHCSSTTGNRALFCTITSEFLIYTPDYLIDAALPLLPKWCPKPMMNIAPVNTAEYSTVIIECCCIAYPLADIRWMQKTPNDQEWHNLSELLNLTTKSESGIRTYSLLKIPAISNYFLFQFRCICSNKHGETKSNATWFLFQGNYCLIISEEGIWSGARPRTSSESQIIYKENDFIIQS